MKRKLLSLMLVLTLMAGLALSAHADVLWEPYGDSYYQSHSGDFSIVRDYYYCNGTEGAVVAYTQPYGDPIMELANGMRFFVYYICTASDGSRWGVNDHLVNDEWVTLYVPMEDMLNVYDDEFFADRSEDITQDRPEDLTCMWEGEYYQCWTYPRGAFSSVVNHYKGEDFARACSSFYIDSEGLVWGYIGYWMGHQDYWVCLSDMDNPDLAEPEYYMGTVFPAEPTVPQTEEPETTQTETTQAETVKPLPAIPETHDPAEKSLKVLYIVLPVAAVVIAAALLLFWPRKKRG